MIVIVLSSVKMFPLILFACIISRFSAQIKPFVNILIFFYPIFTYAFSQYPFAKIRLAGNIPASRIVFFIVSV